MDDWQTRYAHVYADLDPAAQHRVLSTIQNGALSGWEPTEDDVRRVVRLELGEITTAEAIAEIVGRTDARILAREEHQFHDKQV
ncbi:MAG: hypothetical protein JW722_03350 [Demequinaceae bacterium]|nr:hypothetical protein [Demequinaceae bacterium]